MPVATQVSDRIADAVKVSDTIADAVAVPFALKIPFMNWFELIPILITFFMMMTSLINQDVKGLIWLAFTLFGFSALLLFYKNTTDVCENTIFPLFAKYKTCSVSSFFIVFTLFYLLLPMLHLNNLNFFVLFSFVLFYLTDIVTKQKLCNFNVIGIFVGSLIGALYGLVCFHILLSSSGDKFLYFSSTSSNNVYCSKPKNQTFKCSVYKNGQIISTL